MHRTQNVSLVQWWAPRTSQAPSSSVSGWEIGGLRCRRRHGGGQCTANSIVRRPNRLLRPGYVQRETPSWGLYRMPAVHAAALGELYRLTSRCLPQHRVQAGRMTPRTSSNREVVEGDREVRPRGRHHTLVQAGGRYQADQTHRRRSHAE